MMKLLLVPTTFVALYMRRYGPEYHRAGLALFITAMIARPDRAEPRAGLVAAGRLCGCGLGLSAAPGALAALGGARSCSPARGLSPRADRRSHHAGAQSSPPERRSRGNCADRAPGWPPVRAAAIAATAELPQRQAASTSARADVYRLQLAVAFLLEAAPDPGSPIRRRGRSRRNWRLSWRRCASIAMGPWPGVAKDDVHTALARLIETVMEAPLADELQRYDLLRGAAALGVARGDGRAGDRPAPRRAVAAHDRPPAREDQAGLRPTTRVACQGLAASAVTTALDLGLGLSHAYWATLTVMLVIGSSFGETALRARHRTFGTGLGAGLGIAVAVLLQDSPWTLAGLCILGQMLGALTAQRRYAVSAAAIGFSVVVGLHLLGGLGAGDMLARIYETAIGAGVALLASRLVLPVYGGDQARQQIRAILARCRAACAAWWPPQPAAPTPESANQLVRELILLEERLPELNTEAVLGQRSAAEVVRLSTFLRVLQTYLVLIEQAAARLAEADDLGTAEAVLAEFRGTLLAAFDEPGSGVERPMPTRSG